MYIPNISRFLFIKMNLGVQDLIRLLLKMMIPYLTWLWKTFLVLICEVVVLKSTLILLITWHGMKYTISSCVLGWDPEISS